MKICPACHEQFADNLVHCPHDGAALSSSQTIPATVQFTKNSPDNDSMIGRSIAGRFHIISKLGEGGMGTVYKAEHTKMNRLCAIKIMNPAIAQSKDSLAWFNREAQLSSKLEHPHAVTIYDFGEAEDGLVYLAMEFVEGEMLSTILGRDGSLSVERTLDIARQAGAALEAAHKMSIVHRDLKPDNIMVGKKNGRDWIKVLDFGIAKATDDIRNDLTQAGMVVGTPLYMSPEQLAGEKIDARSDIYSFALIVYQLLTGALPFKGENTQAVMIKRLTENPLPIQLVNGNVRVPANLESSILQALSKDRNQRPQTVSQFIANLDSGNSGTEKINNELAKTVVGVPGVSTNPFPPAQSYNTIAGQPAGGTNQSMPTMVTPHTPQPMQAHPSGGFVPSHSPFGGHTPPQSMPPHMQSGPMGGPPNFQPPPMNMQMGGPAQQKSKGSGVGVIIGIIVVLFLLGGGGISAYFMFGTKKDPIEDKESKNKDKKEGKDGKDSKEKTSDSSLSQQVFYDQGVSSMQQKNYSEAAEKFRKAIELSPEFGDAHLNLGTALFNLYQLQESIDEYKLATRYCTSDENKHKAYYGRGLSNWEMKKYDQAADDFGESYKLNPANHEQIAFRGFMLQLASRASEANSAYDSYLSLNNSGNIAEAVKQCRNQGAQPPATLKETGFMPEF